MVVSGILGIYNCLQQIKLSEDADWAGKLSNCLCSLWTGKQNKAFTSVRAGNKTELSPQTGKYKY